MIWYKTKLISQRLVVRVRVSHCLYTQLIPSRVSQSVPNHAMSSTFSVSQLRSYQQEMARYHIILTGSTYYLKVAVVITVNMIMPCVYVACNLPLGLLKKAVQLIIQNINSVTESIWYPCVRSFNPYTMTSN